MAKQPQQQRSSLSGDFVREVESELQDTIASTGTDTAALLDTDYNPASTSGGIVDDQEKRRQGIAKERNMRVSAIYQNTYSRDREYAYTRSHYKVFRQVEHQMRDSLNMTRKSIEPAAILQQHSDKDFYYILIGDLDASERKLLGRAANRARAEGKQLHEVLRSLNMPNGNQALEFFLHRTRVTGYKLEINAGKVLSAV